MIFNARSRGVSDGTQTDIEPLKRSSRIGWMLWEAASIFA
jgi:hypothetical protein